MAQFAVILPAAGSSTRFAGTNKLRESLNGISILERSLLAYALRADVAMIVVACSNTTPDISTSTRIKRCAGGPSRAESVLRALREVPTHIEWVAVHDAARPLVSQDLIDRTLCAAVEYGAAAPAMPVALTIKQAAGPLPAKVHRTIARDELWAMQTPQITRRDELLHAFEHCPIPLSQVTDDVQLIELAGKEVWLIPGDERNIKITTVPDLKVAELILTESN